MILILLILSAVAFFMSFIYVDRLFPRTLLTLISGVVLILSLIAIVANFHDHFGLQKVTTQRSFKIYSAAGSKMPIGLLLYQPIGTSGKDNVYIYATKSNQKKPSHTQADAMTKNRLTRVSSENARLQTSETRWEYRSAFNRLLFGLAGNGHELTHRVNRFYLPKSWLRLSTIQAKALQKQMSSAKFQAQAKSQGAAYVQAQMQAAIAKQPSLAADRQAQQRLGKQFAADFQMQLIQETVSKLNK
ncbi:DUF4811 domain-containing protein [Oenococcus kitaharae]|uniref:DUF4811 domain-containing protein n=1 Tax=Oenococcus kitaharae DSM 17330 TaxID=1045004 RepID=G9WG77_9LACO|nr:DUF4811 domain-containing protein [Oenococcus kitaharae]EHN59685.1 hypothetical protein OKIT_1608 [Oenococcus kitaharae DSM 17330]OEY83519.1 hypothetical protein NT95_05245 [Oenococcus kitaharae]OEY85318.1 hypothetical protein NT96_01690 [Oenococcus kitaharae]OEY86172.1 hypothetical protein NV75_01640 [Oenococcus kitaharae]